MPGQIRLLNSLAEPTAFLLEAGSLMVYNGNRNEKCKYIYKPQRKSLTKLVEKNLIEVKHTGSGKSKFWYITKTGRDYVNYLNLNKKKVSS